MDFDFLTPLPKSNLDDRTFKDLVDECLLRIPRYCPEWTNHNPSDPGVTLIELFAWLTDQMLLRFNQVPRRQYVAFLELLGIRLDPPAPAHTVVTFYLTRFQDTQRSLPPIPAGIEVATEQSDAQPAVIFSTSQDLPFGVPRILYFLTEEEVANPDETRRAEDEAKRIPREVQNRLTNQWNDDDRGRWTGRPQSVFQTLPQVGDRFYLVFDPNEPLDGNVIQLSIEGESAGSTGINPTQPPRIWEAWDGDQWRPALLKEEEDGTLGFSFDDVVTLGPNGLSEADIRLHLPLTWVPTTFGGYYGRWLRCRCVDIESGQFSRSPRLSSFYAQTMGGAVAARQCTRISNELVGESDGNPGQVFYLQAEGILERQGDEYLQVTPPGEPPQRWQEVPNFANSGPSDRHYTLDSRTGRIQFGPLIREPKHLQEEVQLRRQIQGGQSGTASLERVETLERQYGAAPPRGAVLHMVAYRTGGGDRGNVPANSIQVLKTAVPYVKQLTNHAPARDGANEESLEEAVLRVPRFLRTRDRAVTAEDYETLTLQASRAVGRAYCPAQQRHRQPGVVTVYVVPRISTLGWEHGVPPEEFRLTPDLRREIEDYLGDRCLLGTQLELREPDYVGVSIQARLGVERDYRLGVLREALRRQLLQALYTFLHPLTGGTTGQGWDMGRPLYSSDLVRRLQTTPGVQFLDTIQLFELRLEPDPQRPSQLRWRRRSVDLVDPGPVGVICSWSNARDRSAHQIEFVGDGSGQEGEP